MGVFKLAQTIKPYLMNIICFILIQFLFYQFRIVLNIIKLEI